MLSIIYITKNYHFLKILCGIKHVHKYLNIDIWFNLILQKQDETNWRRIGGMEY